MERLNYVELPVSSSSRAAAFYGRAFGWHFTEYGPAYAAHEEPPCEIAVNASEGRAAAILPVIESDDIAAARAAVLAAGGTILRETYAYPGGRRFHFTDPDGLELAVYQKDG